MLLTELSAIILIAEQTGLARLTIVLFHSRKCFNCFDQQIVHRIVYRPSCSMLTAGCLNQRSEGLNIPVALRHCR